MACNRGAEQRLPDTVDGAVNVPVAVNLLPMKLPLPEKLLPLQVALVTVVFTLKPPRLRGESDRGWEEMWARRSVSSVWEKRRMSACACERGVR